MRSVVLACLCVLATQLHAQRDGEFIITPRAGIYGTWHSFVPPEIRVSESPGAVEITPTDDMSGSGPIVGLEGRYGADDGLVLSFTAQYAELSPRFFDSGRITGTDFSSIYLPGRLDYQLLQLEVGIHARFLRRLNWLDLQLGAFFGPNLHRITTAEFIDVDVAPRARFRYNAYREAEQQGVGIGAGISTRLGFFVARRVGFVIDGRAGLSGTEDAAGFSYSLQGGLAYAFGGRSRRE